MGTKATVIGYNLKLTNQTDKKIFIIDAPIRKDSVITSWPGKAYVKKLEAKDCWRLNPACLNKAPSAMKLQAKANAGLRILTRDFNPFK